MAHITGRRAIVALILLLVATVHVLVPGSALAHAYLDHADPPPGSTLSQAPSQLRLTFSEQVDSAFSQVHVLNARRETFDRGDSAVAADDPRVMVVSLQTGLADGVYTVAWRTLSADDGHSESGAYTLVFGTAAGAVGVTQPQSSAAEFSAETALARWWQYLAASLVFGPLLAWQIVFRPLLQGGDSAARVVAMLRTRPLVLLGALALVAGTLYAALAQAASASGLPLWSVVGRPLHDVLTSGHYASVWWPRLSLALICLVLLAWRGIDGLAGDLMLAMMPAVLLTSSLASHAAAVPGWYPLAIGADWLHFMAVAAWLGGLASMVFVLPGVVGGVARAFGRSVRAELVLGVLVLGVAAILTGLAAAQPVSAPLKQTVGHVRQFQLTVGRTQWELAPGKVVDAYTYNGQVPGPELRVTEGDTVRVAVKNELDEPTTVHWHGVDVPAAMDGVPDTSGPAIAPGGTFTYEFVATPAGTRWYHAHFDELNQQGGGLTGALVIEPRDPPSTKVDREYTLITGEWVAAAGKQAPSVPTPSAIEGMAGMGGGMMGNGGGMSSASARPAFDTFTVNGTAYPSAAPLVVRQGERVRLRLINASATDTQVFALAGHRLTVTHSDGNPLANPVDVDAVPLGVGERADVEFVADNPGRWKLEALMPALSDQGQMVDLTDVVYDGHQGDAARDFPAGARIRIASYADFSGPPHPAAPDRTYELTLSGGMMMMSMGSDAWTINGRSYPDTPPIDVKVGQRIRLRLFNMSMEDHPMHLHGHTFQVVAINGRSIDGPLKDTITLRHMEQYDIEFVADNPGTWLFHCHNLVHMMGGLMTQVRYS